MYAIPSYVDDNTPTVKRNAMNLLEGPNSKTPESDSSHQGKRSSKRNYILFGHYENPSVEKMFDTIGPKGGDQQISVRPENSLWYLRDSEEASSDDDKIIIPDESRQRNNANVSVLSDDATVGGKGKYGLLKTSTIKFKTWFDNEENKILKLLMVILIGIVITMFWYFHTTVRELRQQSQNGSKTPRSTDSNGSYGVDSFDGGKFANF